MRTLIACHLDGMADFDGVKPVRNERVISEARKIGRPLGLQSMHRPSSGRADHECCQARCDRGKCTKAATCQPIKSKARRRCFVLEVAIAVAKKLCLLAPCRDPRGVFGMG